MSAKQPAASFNEAAWPPSSVPAMWHYTWEVNGVGEEPLSSAVFRSFPQVSNKFTLHTSVKHTYFASIYFYLA